MTQVVELMSGRAHEFGDERRGPGNDGSRDEHRGMADQ